VIARVVAAVKTRRRFASAALLLRRRRSTASLRSRTAETAASRRAQRSRTWSTRCARRLLSIWKGSRRTANRSRSRRAPASTSNARPPRSA